MWWFLVVVSPARLAPGDWHQLRAGTIDRWDNIIRFGDRNLKGSWINTGSVGTV